jgi:hypothetical protein
VICSRGEGKVVGLGAPISVKMRLQPSEVPRLQTQLRNELTVRELHRPESHSTTAALEWTADRQILQDMLRSLDANGDGAGSIEVCWPTSVAHSVLRNALVDALADLGRRNVDRCGLDELGEALDAALACFGTWVAFEAVDLGGLA